MTLFNILYTGALVASILVTILIILNQPQTDATFGNSESFARTRRGAEKRLHSLTILASVSLLVLIIALHLVA
jgi:protein translocase SecG subunit